MQVHIKAKKKSRKILLGKPNDFRDSKSINYNCVNAPRNPVPKCKEIICQTNMKTYLLRVLLNRSMKINTIINAISTLYLIYALQIRTGGYNSYIVIQILSVKLLKISSLSRNSQSSSEKITTDLA